jgi:hypothetical protein
MKIKRKKSIMHRINKCRLTGLLFIMRQILMLVLKLTVKSLYLESIDMLGLIFRFDRHLLNCSWIHPAVGYTHKGHSDGT